VKDVFVRAGETEKKSKRIQAVPDNLENIMHLLR
jgi:hypothetical protein